LYAPIVALLKAYPESRGRLSAMFRYTQRDLKRHINTLELSYEPKSDLIPVSNWRVETYIGAGVLVEALEECSSPDVRLTKMVAHCIPLSLFDAETFRASLSSACAQLT
jgi:hypothetical protein